ncbi:MAG TPA: O-antigen ligase family protein [Solirubrobacterales bacterium]|nr:O-antigen ligase family protein [Solirubrobacterales bacterium]
MALIVGLALAGGGFEVSARHVAGLAVWLVVVALLVLGAASRATLARPFYWGAGLIALLSLLSAISSSWSGSVELSVIEADRVLVYLGIFLAAFLIAQTDERRQRFAEGLTIAVALVALLGLASRLTPHVVDVANSLGSGPRLRYPLGYWNANGAIFGIAVALLLWSSRRAAWNTLRWLSVAVLPAVLLALYFTYSRGGLLALLVAAGCTIALSRDRLWLLATLGAGALGTLPAVLAVQARRSLADNYFSQGTIDQGAEVLLILLGGIALTLLLFAALRWAERRGGGLTGRAVELSRNPTLLKGIAAGVAVVAIGVAIAIGGRAWDQFSSSDVQFPSRPEQHFSQLSGAGRHDFFRVAIDALEEKPVLGGGAGTYQFAWEQHRSIAQPVHDAHSLYLEAFAELGTVGGLLVLALVGVLLWAGFSAWRAAIHPQRERYAALFAATLAVAVVAGLDWFWEVAGLGAVFFCAAGLLVAARCAQLSPSPEEAVSGDERRFGLAVAGLAVAWIAAIALIGPLLVEREIDASQSAAAAGDFGSATNHAKTARSIEPFAASPYVQLGLLAEAQGDYATAIEHFTQAIDREDRNWQLYYLRSRVEQEAGDQAAAKADLIRARRLNPLDDCLRGKPSCG